MKLGRWKGGGEKGDLVKRGIWDKNWGNGTFLKFWDLLKIFDMQGVIFN